MLIQIWQDDLNYYRLDVFKKKSLNELLDSLEGYHSKVSPDPLEQEQF